jgi:hypothetical protein
MKKIAIAALFTALGGGASLAQGAPPGSPSWHSGWPSRGDIRQEATVAAPAPMETRSSFNKVAAPKPTYLAGNSRRIARGG